MNCIKRQIIQENMNLIPGYNNYWRLFVWLCVLDTVLESFISRDFV